MSFGNPDAGLATARYFDRSFDIESVKVLPGEFSVSDQDIMMVTVLGSCVTACIRDQQTGIGGMNHFMLPDSGSGVASESGSAARYGDYAMAVLVDRLLRLGARRDRLEAKVFGGGNVIPSMTVTNVGERNARFALAWLAAERIAVVARDLVDVHPRKVHFFPRSGKVLVKHLKNTDASLIVEREAQLARPMQRPAGPTIRTEFA
ncbi:MAG: chemoreceptor glutamine deamidase CheD [Lautropia sp.]